MHIHSYQIHNVLNVYRRQLSQGTARGISAKAAKMRPTLDRIDLMGTRRHQSIFDKISSEIVERITRFEPEADESGSTGQMEKAGVTENQNDENLAIPAEAENETIFAYTLIDEHDHKTTQILPIRQFSTATEEIEFATNPQTVTGTNSDSQ